MADTIAEKKTRLEKLAEQKAAIEAKLKAEKERIQKQERRARTAENAKLRKADTRKKIEFGGLAKIAGLLDTDKGLMLGLLLHIKTQMEEKPEKLEQYKLRGDSILKQREDVRKGETSNE